MVDERYGVLKEDKLICFNMDGDGFFFFDSVEAVNGALRDIGLIGTDVEIIKLTDMRPAPSDDDIDLDTIPTVKLTYREWS